MLAACHFIFGKISNEKVFTVTVTATLVRTIFAKMRKLRKKIEYPQDCLPQDCLLVGNPEVGNSEYIIHQDCLPQFYIDFSALAEWNNVLKVLKHQPDPSLRFYTSLTAVYNSPVSGQGGSYVNSLKLSQQVVGRVLHGPDYQLISDLSKSFFCK